MEPPVNNTGLAHHKIARKKKKIGEESAEGWRRGDSRRSRKDMQRAF